MIAPDTTATLGFMLERIQGVVAGLVPYQEKMRENLDRAAGLYFSEAVLLALVDKGLARQEAYEMVQKNAMEAFHGEGDFRELLRQDQRIKAHLSDKELDDCFDLEHALRWAKTIVERAIQA
jgi:adenylosuccinate lyase